MKNKFEWERERERVYSPLFEMEYPGTRLVYFTIDCLKKNEIFFFLLIPNKKVHNSPTNIVFLLNCEHRIPPHL